MCVIWRDAQTCVWYDLFILTPHATHHIERTSWRVTSSWVSSLIREYTSHFADEHMCIMCISQMSIRVISLICLHLLRRDTLIWVRCTATHCNTLQHTATHCNTLRHTATRCNTLQHTCRSHVDMSTVDKWDSLRSLIRVSRHTNEGSVGSLLCMQVSFECVRLFWVCKALLSVWVFFECVGLVCVVVTHWFVTHWYVTHWYVTHWYVTHWYVTHCNVSRRTNEGSVGNDTHNVAWMCYVTWMPCR